MRVHGGVRLVAALSLLLAPAAVQAGEGIAWQKSFDAALGQAKESGKLVMADFFTDW